VSYDEVLEDRYISVTVLYVTAYFVMWLYYCFVIFIIMLCVIVMYVPFCVIVLICVLFLCEYVLDNCHRDIGALFDYPN
jgi:hypothetical protein